MAPKDKAPQGLGPPGPNPLFFGVVLGLALGIVAGLSAGDAKPGAALDSNLVFRVQVGVIVAVAAYWAVGALWLSWHRTLFRRLGLGNAGAEPPEKEAALEKRDDEVTEFMDRTTETLDQFRERIEDLEERPSGQRAGGGTAPPGSNQ